VLITGGNSGIGALLAETLGKRGATVVVLARDQVQAELPANIHTYVCDVGDWTQVRSVADRVTKEVGEPTIMVNNAGVVKGKLLLDLTEADIQDTFASNTLAHFYVLKAFLPGLLRRGRGHIVTMSSIMGLVGAAQMTDYCASKAALVALHQSLRFELDNRYHTPSVRTTLVLPSIVTTPLFSHTVIPSFRLFRFLAPHVPPRAVVGAIVDALEAQESRVIRLPWYSNAARLMGDAVGLVPAWLRDLLQRIAGADIAMRAYGPHPDAAERLEAERKQARG